MIFAFHVRAPRQRMPLEPGIPLFLPSLKQVSRKRISQSKRDEITAPFCCQCGRRFFVTRMWSCGSNNFMARRYYTAAPRHFDFGEFISKLGGEFGTASSDQH